MNGPRLDWLRSTALFRRPCNSPRPNRCSGTALPEAHVWSRASDGAPTPRREMQVLPMGFHPSRRGRLPGSLYPPQSLIPAGGLGRSIAPGRDAPDHRQPEGRPSPTHIQLPQGPPAPQPGRWSHPFPCSLPEGSSSPISARSRAGKEGPARSIPHRSPRPIRPRCGGSRNLRSRRSSRHCVAGLHPAASRCGNQSSAGSFLPIHQSDMIDDLRPITHFVRGP